MHCLYKNGMVVSTCYQAASLYARTVGTRQSKNGHTL